MGAKVTCFGGGLCLPICFSPKISTFDSTGDEIVTGATKPQSRRPASLKNKLVRYFSCLTKRTVPIEDDTEILKTITAVIPPPALQVLSQTARVRDIFRRGLHWVRSQTVKQKCEDTTASWLEQRHQATPYFMFEIPELPELEDTIAHRHSQDVRRELSFSTCASAANSITSETEDTSTEPLVDSEPEIEVEAAQPEFLLDSTPKVEATFHALPEEKSAQVKLHPETEDTIEPEIEHMASEDDTSPEKLVKLPSGRLITEVQASFLPPALLAPAAADGPKPKPKGKGKKRKPAGGKKKKGGKKNFKNY